MLKSTFKQTLLLAFLVGACGESGNIASTANEVAQPQDLQFEVREVPTPAEVKDQLKSLMLTKQRSTVAPVVPDAGTMINIAKAVWEIIVKNRPVTDIANDYAVAVPAGVTDVTQLTGFSELTTKSYEWVAKTRLGTQAFSIVYTVVNQHGGKFQGKGSYLTTVSVIPSNVRVAWGWKVNFRAKQVSMSNLGDLEDPIAGMTLELTMEAETPLMKTSSSRLYLVRGDNGAVQEAPL